MDSKMAALKALTDLGSKTKKSSVAYLLPEEERGQSAIELILGLLAKGEGGEKMGEEDEDSESREALKTMGC